MLKNINLIPELVKDENIFNNFNDAIKELQRCQLDFKSNPNKQQKRKILWRY